MQYYLDKDSFQTLLAKPDLSRLDKILLILFWDNESPKTISKIKEIASINGLREIHKWNISDTLGKAKGKAILIKNDWTLTISGKSHIIGANLLNKHKSNLTNDVTDLRVHLATINNSHTKNFLEEAISCLEADQKRAAVVFSWIGAVSLLYDEVINNHLPAFNVESIRRDAKWKPAKNADDLGKMKEVEFLNTLESISIIGKNVKQELQQCLQLRNACGHPNSLMIGVRKVAAHIEILILNVFSKF
ncbi:hypothetical protein HDF18_10530 [Mucilaginibacter sp. X5P1]|uniref:hypothetical protein n=1 Tax=Mucilaginibacter sp. X5P1 TaxID=2723088 RepID=UPI001621D4F6|nr:hypothetical protein [Mucilaginibacter sp. X5P1]MBB6140743.1 hypothetical protein [Mucilaginibacter sp. X5P1]